MKKVRCDYSIKEDFPDHSDDADGYFQTLTLGIYLDTGNGCFYFMGMKSYSTRGDALADLEFLATKLNIELGEEVG